MSNKISKKDKKDWEKFLSNKEKLVSKDPEDEIKNCNKRIRSIDLHGYSLEEANNKSKDLILKSNGNVLPELNKLSKIKY